MHISILETGALPDGKTPATAAIETAIRRVADAGGGTVVVPAGDFLTGMVRLRSHVELHLARGARLKAAPQPEDHHPWVQLPASGDHWHKNEPSFHLVCAIACEDVAISGPGELDGHGPAFYDPVEPGTAWPLARHRDSRRMGGLVMFHACRDVTVRDCRMGNVCNWTLVFSECDAVRVRDVIIRNPHQAPNSDGIDIVGCRDVSISGCHIDTGDDAICLKTLPQGRSCENVNVTHCVIQSHCAALKLGASESFQDMRHVTFSNCVVRGSHRVVALYSLEGAMMEHILVQNISFDTCAALMFTRPIHVDIRRKSPESRLGGLRFLTISGMSGETNGRSLFTCETGGVLSDLVLRDLSISLPTFDDPALQGREHGGGQFSSKTPNARVVRAAFVFENAERVTLNGLHLRWPDNQTPPSAWTFTSKLANGTERLFTPEDWTLAADTPVHVLALRNVKDSQFQIGTLQGWQGGTPITEYTA